jgi:HD superfamily phosphodiesterase
MEVVAEHDRAHGVALEVERERKGLVRQLDHLALHDLAEAVDTHDAVGNANDRALGTRLGARIEVLDALLDQLADFRRVDLHGIGSS